MHKVAFSFALMIFSLSAIAGAESAIQDESPAEYKWHHLGEAENQKISINMESIRRLYDDAVAVLTRSDFPAARKNFSGIEYKYAVIKHMIYCDGRTIVMLYTDFYSQDNQLVDTYYRELLGVKAEKIPANSLLDEVAKVACPIGLEKEPELIFDNRLSVEDETINTLIC